MKKFILKVELPDDKAKHKALKTVSTLSGIDSIAMDMREKQLTVIGTVDPITVVTKLRKHWPTDIVIVGPAKEPEKPQDPNEPKKEDNKEPPKKEEEEEAAKKDEVKEEDKKKEIAVVPDPLLELAKVYPEPTSYYYVQSTEENPNACVVS